jgi:hypothetical protein
MPTYRVNKIRWPDEFRYALSSVAENFANHAEATDDLRTIVLNGLSPQQALTHDIFSLVSEVDEIIENLNMSMFDMGRLGDDARAFADRNPFNRFQFLVRMYFYEYGRFKDRFGYFTQWKFKAGLMTKAERKLHCDAFYIAYEDAIKTRNIMMHDGVTWESQCSPEIAILQALEATGRVAVDKLGQQLAWETHLGPLCARTLPVMHAMAQHMQVFWNMEMADLAVVLVGNGTLPKATKPFVGRDAAAFLKADPGYT